MFDHDKPSFTDETLLYIHLVIVDPCLFFVVVYQKVEVSRLHFFFFTKTILIRLKSVKKYYDSSESVEYGVNFSWDKQNIGKNIDNKWSSVRCLKKIEYLL